MVLDRIGEGYLVFGYGSLVAREALARFLGRPLVPGEIARANLVGYVRRWNVAMDNGKALPGYKVYLDEDGGRPDVAVTFLNVAPRAGSEVNGIVVRVTAAEFARIRGRERNYRLTDVSGDLDPPPEEPVYTSLGRSEAVIRFEEASRQGKAVVTRDYRQGVERAFRSLGPAPFAAYRATTEDPGIPCLPLRRVDLP